MKNIVNNVSEFIEQTLARLDPIMAFAVCAALSVVALVVQIAVCRAFTRTVGDYRRVRRFVVKRGEIVSSNAHRFYKQCVKHMGRRIRRAWKRHTLTGREYAGSALKFEFDRALGRERKIPSVYIPCAFAVAALLQTVLLCKGLPWATAIAYTAGVAAVWAVFAVPAAIYRAHRGNRNAKAAAKLSEILAAKLTLRPAEGRLYVLPVEAKTAPAVREQTAPARTLCDAALDYLASEPDKEVAKAVCDGLEKSGAYACKDGNELAKLNAAVGSMKKYTA